MTELNTATANTYKRLGKHAKTLDWSVTLMILSAEMKVVRLGSIIITA